MIKFNAEFKVNKIEHKSVTKRDGTPFDFIEATLEEGLKRKTYIVARVNEDIARQLKEGEKSILQIEVTSWKRDDGKIWNNFVVTDVAIPEIFRQDPVKPFEADEDIPF